MEQFINLVNSLPDWLQAIAVVLVALNAIAALTPTPKDDTAIGKALLFVRKLIDLLALNVGNAKNASD